MASLEKEIEGTREQLKAVEEMDFEQLDSWPAKEGVKAHLEHCEKVLTHLKEARKLLGEARSEEASTRIQGMQQVELQVRSQRGRIIAPFATFCGCSARTRMHLLNKGTS